MSKKTRDAGRYARLVEAIMQRGKVERGNIVVSRITQTDLDKIDEILEGLGGNRLNHRKYRDVVSRRFGLYGGPIPSIKSLESDFSVTGNCLRADLDRTMRVLCWRSEHQSFFLKFYSNHSQTATDGPTKKSLLGAIENLEREIQNLKDMVISLP